MMSRNNTLTVKEFGPIRKAEVSFSRYTVFVGPQGVGKSTLAKLYSMFLWLEKRLVRGMTTARQLEQDSRFEKTCCGYHRLSSYFREGTEIEFHGQSYLFSYRDGRLSVKETENDSLKVVKVMYVPSERNFLSSLGNLNGLKNLPPSLQTFKDEYESANRAYQQGYLLPIGDVSFEYDRLDNTSWLKGAGYKVRLSEASSGFQALLPMILVTQYLTDFVARHHESESNILNIDELDKLKEEVKKVVENTGLTPEVREAALSALSSRFAYSGFVNIVEEPEENLYPDSQRRILFKLLQLTNQDPGNRLVMTTHSPYLINYLTLAIKGHELIQNGADKEDVSHVVPGESVVSGDEVSIYELKDGHARRLTMNHGLPSDSNYLNMALGEANNMFDTLLDIEDNISLS